MRIASCGRLLATTGRTETEEVVVGGIAVRLGKSSPSKGSPAPTDGAVAVGFGRER